MLVDDDEDDVIKVVPIDSSMAEMMNLQNEEEKDEQEMEHPLAHVRSMKSVEPLTKLKDLFTPREEEGKCIQVLTAEAAQSTAGC